MLGNGVLPNNSTGVTPSNAERSSEAICGVDARLTTTKMLSSPYVLRYAAIRVFGSSTHWNVPRPNALYWRRTRNVRRVQFSNEVGLRFCASTLTDWYP